MTKWGQAEHFVDKCCPDSLFRGFCNGEHFFWNIFMDLHHTGIPVWHTTFTSNSDDGFSSPWGRSWSCCTVWLRAAPQEWVVPLLGVQNGLTPWQHYKMGCHWVYKTISAHESATKWVAWICQSIPPNSLQHMARNKKYIDIYWWIISKLNENIITFRN